MAPPQRCPTLAQLNLQAWAASAAQAEALCQKPATSPGGCSAECSNPPRRTELRKCMPPSFPCQHLPKQDLCLDSREANPTAHSLHMSFKKKTGFELVGKMQLYILPLKWAALPKRVNACSFCGITKIFFSFSLDSNYQSVGGEDKAKETEGSGNRAT